MSQQADNRPNVLLICTDHWSGRMLRPAGHPTVMTPTLSQLASLGTYYPNAYSACPVCVPARRTLMTGLSTATQGAKRNASEPMPEATTIAQAFRDAGYQAYAAGKLHVFPQRNRIGFDDVILNEEGRMDRTTGQCDDYEQYLAEQGYAGQMFGSGLNNNDYMTRAWHLPEQCHPSNWTAREMTRLIHRRDPSRPGFWYMSFTGPHPPVWPPQSYMDLYRDVPIDPPYTGDWSDESRKPSTLRSRGRRRLSIYTALEHEVELARRAFYATLTHIDHQIRLVLGYLREAGLMQNTIVAFTADHGEMLGNHGMWGKGLFYQDSANVPLIVVPAGSDEQRERGIVDQRIAELRDVMPTLLNLAGVPIPDTVEGLSLVGDDTRPYLYGEMGSGPGATRMIRADRYKLIYYSAGNVVQLFDLENDPRELTDLSCDEQYASVRQQLEGHLVESLAGEDRQWINNGRLVGVDAPEPGSGGHDFGLSQQRGLRLV